MAVHLPELTGSTWFTEWTAANAVAWVTVAALAAAVVAVVQLHRRQVRWPVGRSLAAVSGTAVVVWCTAGPVGVYARALFWINVVQLLALLVLAPLLLVCARPVTLVRLAGWSKPPPDRRPNRAADVLTNPIAAALVPPLVMGVVYFTGVFGLVLRHLAAAQAEQLLLVLIGCLLARGIVGGLDDSSSSAALGLAAGVAAVELLLDAVPGILLRLRSDLVAPPTSYLLHRSWGPSPLNDQHLAGSILWGFGELADLPFIIVIVRRWIRADEREAAVIDATLDREQLRERALTPPEESADGDTTVPWWITDPDRLGAERSRRLRGS
jgi:putative copper resistance protein D